MIFIKLEITDSLYPDSLRRIPNAPQQIFYEGNLDLTSNPALAIIGSRKSTENGNKIAQKFSTELSMTGITIVSGLATGIDTIAHKYSYMNKGKTIAVLGCGFNKIFPKENIPLYKQIISNGGLIISEYEPNERYHQQYFLDRNRIISGLSLGVLVIEAMHRSGTSVTAKHARSQGKKVFSIPHEIWDSHGVGTNRLIKNGATLVTSTVDILAYSKFKKYRKYYQKLKSNNSFEAPMQLTSLKFDNPKHVKIYDVIKSIQNSGNSASVDAIIFKSNLQASEAISILFFLELNGYIKKVEGGYICT